ncbi:MAG: heparinase II/III family protein, partial [Opitutales bacterium]
ALRGAGRAASALASPGVAAPRGLLFDAGDLPRIRATVLRPEFREFWTFMTTVDFAAEAKFLKAELRFTNHITDMARAQTIMLRSAFVHLLTPDTRHLAIARLALSRLLGYPRWDWLRDSQQRPVGVMRGAGTCIALALVAEWLAADLTAEEQAAITHGLSTEGGPPCYRGLHDMTHHDEVGPWSLTPGEEGLAPVDVSRWPRILDETNLRIICTAGLAAATCHLYGRHPDAPQWLAMTRDSLQRYAARMPKDGTFGEGIGYWDFTFSHYIFALELLRRKLDVDERALLDFPAMARYALEMTMPTAGHPDDCISIGDAATAAGSVPLAWIAREFRDAGAQQLVLQPRTIRPAWTTSWAAVWFDPAVPAQRPADARLDGRQALGIVISRTGWEEQDAVVTLRSGGPVNHEHADRNSVIFKAHGERLFNDPVHASYWTTDPKWLLRQTEAHTAVLIDGQGHIYHDGHDGTNSSPAAATIQDYHTGPGWMTVTSDAGDAYRRAGLPAQLVQRTLVYLKPGVLVIFDRVRLDEARPVQARFQVYNDDGAGRVAAEGRTFTIERPQATLLARVTTAGDCTLATSRLALPESGGVYPFAELRSGAAREHTLLTVCSAAPRGEAHGDIQVTQAAGSWRLAGSHRGQTVRATIAIAEPTHAPVITL